MTELRAHAGSLVLLGVLAFNGLAAQPVDGASPAGKLEVPRYVPGEVQPARLPIEGIQIMDAFEYYNGKDLPGDQTVSISRSPSKNMTYALIRHRARGTFINQCGYLATAEIPKHSFKLTRHQNTPTIRHCKQIKPSFNDRKKDGIQYNCVEHGCVDGAPESLTATCNYEAFYNYLPAEGVGASPHQRKYTDNGFYDYVGNLSANALVHYRKTTVDGRAEVIRNQEVDWVYLERSCTYGIPQGGTPKPQPPATLSVSFETPILPATSN